MIKKNFYMYMFGVKLYYFVDIEIGKWIIKNL